MTKALKGLLFPNVSSKYGAPMGRSRVGNLNELPKKLRAQRVSMVDGGYDPGGAYWGISSPPFHLYVVFAIGANGKPEFRDFTRAITSKAAIGNVRKVS